MICLPDRNRDNIMEAVRTNAVLVVGVNDDIMSFVKLGKLDEMVGKTYLCTRNTSHDSPKSVRDVYRIDGYTVCQTGYVANTLCEETLNKNGKFCCSMQIVDRTTNGEPVWAYEREKVFKTMAEAAKHATPGKHWIRMTVVSCCYDERREPHYSDKARKEGLVKL